MTIFHSLRHFPSLLAILFALALPFEARSDTTPASEPFSEARFKALQEEGQLVMVDVSADWCSTCRRQHTAISSVREKHPELKLHVLSVDFDKQKEWVRFFKAPRQSTLILFKGTQQHWFAVAEVREEVILAELQKASAAAASSKAPTSSSGS